MDFLAKFPMVGNAGKDGASIDADKLAVILGIMAYDADRNIDDTVRTAIYLAGQSLHTLSRALAASEEKLDEARKLCKGLEKTVEGLKSGKPKGGEA